MLHRCLAEVAIKNYSWQWLLLLIWIRSTHPITIHGREHLPLDIIDGLLSGLIFEMKSSKRNRFYFINPFSSCLPNYPPWAICVRCGRHDISAVYQLSVWVSSDRLPYHSPIHKFFSIPSTWTFSACLNGEVLGIYWCSLPYCRMFWRGITGCYRARVVRLCTWIRWGYSCWEEGVFDGRDSAWWYCWWYAGSEYWCRRDSCYFQNIYKVVVRIDNISIHNRSKDLPYIKC